jgi:UDP:flavonoid glycosyltransferase YjiC (YdhE family)
MRVLFTAWAWPTHYFPMVPLGWALRASGHEVRVASQPALTDVITQSGLPAVVTGHDVDMKQVFARLSAGAGNPPGTAMGGGAGGGARPGPTRESGAGRESGPESGPESGRGGPAWAGRPPWADRARLPAEQQRAWTIRGLQIFLPVVEAMIGDLIDFAAQWRPDLVVFEPTTYAGPLAAAALGIPAARHLWGIDFTLRTRDIEPEILAPVLDRLGLAEVETLGAVTIDNCPPSLQVPGDYPRLPVRYVPYNGPGTAPGWLLDPPAKPRVCVTWGATNSQLMPGQSATRPVLEALAGADVEVVAALSADDAERLGPPPAGVRVVKGLPLHLLLPTCDLIVHQGGLGTAMTALTCGLPQLVLPVLPDQAATARQLAGGGVARQLPPWEADPDVIRGHVLELLNVPGYRSRAAAVQAEIAAQPSPADLVGELERLVAERQREPETVS